MFNFLKKKCKAREDSPTGGMPGVKTSGPWVGVDLDGTLAIWDDTSSLDRIGAPIPRMVDMVNEMLAHGVRVKIFTARAGDEHQIPLIEKWLEKTGLPPLEITNIKDFEMERLYDDRGIQVVRNTGKIIGG